MRFFIFVIWCVWLAACSSSKTTPTPQPAPTDLPPPALPDTPEPISELAAKGAFVTSPNGKLQVAFELRDGAPSYQVNYEERQVILPSKLGFVFKHAEPLNQNLTIVDSRQTSVDETWSQPWGEVKEIRNHYNELRVNLVDQLERQMTLVFRVHNDGLGFRYELPEQEKLAEFEIMDEETEFALSDNQQAWWIPAFERERYEYLCTQSDIRSLRRAVRAVHTPLTLETTDGLFLSIHEANLTDYAAMTLVSARNNTLLCDLVPWSDGVKVRGATPFQTPWRTIQIAENPGDLITSYLILNLNEPNKLGDVSWLRPAKYVGIWWGMHINRYTWGSGVRHGATTENARQYIDFAAKHGFDGVLIEGWNVGWDGDWVVNGDRFEFSTPHEDFDIQAVSAYASAKGVCLIGHHETGAAVVNYERQLEDAFAFYQALGVDTVKTGYVGWGQGIKRLDENGELLGMEWHHGQYMVRHYRRVLEAAAQYHIMLDVHEPIKDTGLRRTYPNMMTREGARGQEYNAWSGDGGNPPEHTTIIPFTRSLAGPFDFTPGIFNLIFKGPYARNRVNTTLAKQLALYVTIYSPLHMAADLPENYEGQPALQFILDVPVDWQLTKVLHAQIGDYVTIVRQDRHSRDWYLGSITDENGRTLQAPLSFLEPDVQYVAEIYADAADADWQDNPLAIDVYQALVDRDTTLELKLAPGGGWAVRLRPAAQDEIEGMQPCRP